MPACTQPGGRIACPLSRAFLELKEKTKSRMSQEPLIYPGTGYTWRHHLPSPCPADSAPEQFHSGNTRRSPWTERGREGSGGLHGHRLVGGNNNPCGRWRSQPSSSRRCGPDVCVCMYRNVCVCLCVCAHAREHPCAFVAMCVTNLSLLLMYPACECNACTHACMYSACMHACNYVCIYVCMHAYTYLWI